MERGSDLASDTSLKGASALAQHLVSFWYCHKWRQFFLPSKPGTSFENKVGEPELSVFLWPGQDLEDLEEPGPGPLAVLHS